MKKYLITTLICLVLIASVAYGAIIHVPGDQPTIQAGIDAASDGDTVLVADGTYTGDGNRDIDFKGKAITVKSENGAENCIIDCQGIWQKPHRGFYFHSGETETSVVDGFTIKNGWVDSGGGGIGCVYSSPMITNNTITGNSAIGSGNSGGGIDCYGSSPTITNNIITENSATIGGGIHCYESSSTITNNTIIGNSANDGHSGGIGCTYSSPAITNNIIIGNSATSYGGGILCTYSSPTITNNIIAGNSATVGGGIYCHQNSSPMIMNNTITGNLAGDGGGIYCVIFSSPTVLNTILWTDSPGEIYLDEYSSITVTYSDIQGGWPGDGNIDADPLFVDPDNGDYSPCIGAGIMTPDVPDTDIEENPRPNPPGSNPDMGAYENPLGEPLPISGSINGTVTDMAGNPIKWALVIAVLGETKEKAFTDSEGYYEIPDLEPGTYWVLCIKKGYKPGIKKAEVVAGGVTTVDFKLSPKPD